MITTKSPNFEKVAQIVTIGIKNVTMKKSRN